MYTRAWQRMRIKANHRCTCICTIYLVGKGVCPCEFPYTMHDTPLKLTLWRESHISHSTWWQWVLQQLKEITFTFSFSFKSIHLSHMYTRTRTRTCTCTHAHMHTHTHTPHTHTPHTHVLCDRVPHKNSRPWRPLDQTLPVCHWFEYLQNCIDMREWGSYVYYHSVFPFTCTCTWINHHNSLSCEQL